MAVHGGNDVPVRIILLVSHLSQVTLLLVLHVAKVLGLWPNLGFYKVYQLFFWVFFKDLLVYLGFFQRFIVFFGFFQIFIGSLGFLSFKLFPEYL